MEKTRHDATMNKDSLTLEFFLKPLLEKAGISISRNIKLYKHVNHDHDYAGPEYRNEKGDVDVRKIYQDGLMPEFQAANSKKYGDVKDIVLFFIADNGSNSRFIGGFEITKIIRKGTQSESDPAKTDNGLKFYTASHEHWFEFERISSLDCLIDRLEIRWTSGRGIRLLNSDKNSDIEFVQILPKVSFRPFPGFDNVILSFSELKSVTKSNENVGWCNPLKSNRGVYLITDTSTGNLYVGSATGEEGFWARWAQYAKDGHGGNKELKQGITNKTLDPQKFQYSILEIISNFSDKEKGLLAEKLWKRKLGKKARALNAN